MVIRGEKKWKEKDEKKRRQWEENNREGWLGQVLETRGQNKDQ